MKGQMASSSEEAKELLEELHASPRKKANNLPILISFLKSGKSTVRMLIYIFVSETLELLVCCTGTNCRVMHRYFFW